MKYNEWLDKWLILYVQPTVKVRTYDKYTQVVRLYINPLLGEVDIKNLDAIRLQEFVNALLQRGLAASTVNLIISVLQKSLKVAVNASVAETNFADRIIRPKSIQKEIECFSIEEQRKIEQYILSCNSQKYFGVLLCLYTGLRIGELLALEWNDIDLHNHCMSINKSCHYAKDKMAHFVRIIDTPKTESSKRRIPLPRQLVPFLEHAKACSRSSTVISNGTKPVCVRSYQRTFERLLNKLNIHYRGFHTLRHTFATRALECGMDVKTLSEILGHKNPNITLARYAHSFMEHKADMMNRLGSNLTIS